jgi:CBS domain-containing protein
MSTALGFGELRAVQETDANDDETRFEAHTAESAEGSDAEPGGLWALLDRLFFAAMGAVQGATAGWANPSWTRSDVHEEAVTPLPIVVEAVMTRTVQMIGPNATLEEAASRLWQRDCGALPVLDAQTGRRVIGMITDRDVCMAAWSRGSALRELRVSEVMARELVTCHPDDSIREAHRRMRNGQVRRLPVVDEHGDLVGVVALTDLVRRALEALPDTQQAEALAVLKTLSAIAVPRRPE